MKTIGSYGASNSRQKCRSLKRIKPKSLVKEERLMSEETNEQQAVKTPEENQKAFAEKIGDFVSKGVDKERSLWSRIKFVGKVILA